MFLIFTVWPLVQRAGVGIGGIKGRAKELLPYGAKWAQHGVGGDP